MSRSPSIDTSVDQRQPRWGPSIAAILSGQFLAVMGYTSITPFLPLYLQELGVRDHASLALWSGILVGSAPLASGLAAPFWGAIGDRFGQKAIVIRGQVGGAISVFLMVFATTSETLLLLRICVGLFGGSLAPNAALAATTAPAGKIGTALGLVQMAVFFGSSLGPPIGGALASVIGVRGTFLTTACLQLSAALLVSVFVRVGGKPSKGTEKVGLFASVRSVVGLPELLAVAVVAFAIQFASSSVSPVLPLLVQSFGESGSVPAIVGLLFGLTAGASAVSAVAAGRLGDRLGQRPILVASLFLSAAAYLPQAFADTSGKLMAYRVLTGLCIGGSLPSANVLAARIGGASRRAAAIGVVQSASSFGTACGPIVGAGITASLGFSAAFLATALVLAVAAFWAALAVKPTSSRPLW